MKPAYLESYIDSAKVPRRFDLEEFPVVIGRHPECSLQLDIARISRRHAQIDRHDGGFLVTDLDSTNGTYINHRRIEAPMPIGNGDVLHLADHELRLVEMGTETGEGMNVEATMVGIDALPSHFPTQTREFEEMLDRELVQGYRQLITDNRGDPYAYELLGRGRHPDLGNGPRELFALAEALDKEVALSRLLRRVCFRQAAACRITEPLFFNTHPKECLAPDELLRELRDLRATYPQLTLVFEVHEAAVTDLKMMAEVRAALRELDIKLAYDDFGAGQARLLELVEVPADYLKFDISLIQGVSGPDSPKYRLLATLNDLVRELGIRTLAEGVETEETAGICAEIGIDLFQGYFYGRPEPIR